MQYPEVVPLARRNYSAIMEIELGSFLYNWDQHKLDQMCKLKNHIGMIANLNGTVVGYMVYKLCDKHIELIRFAVHPSYRNRGIGYTMMTKVKSRLTPGKRQRLQAIISEWNDEGHAWLKGKGFLATSVITTDSCDYYEFEYFLDEDAVEHDKMVVAGIEHLE